MQQSIEYKKTNLTLPESVAETLQAFEDRDERDQYIATLRSLGWTLQSIAESAGLTRERVRQIVKDTEPGAIEDTMPLPPVKEKKQPRVVTQPDPAKIDKLLTLQPYAQKVRGNSPMYREEGEAYTRLIAEVHLEDGVSLYTLSKHLGVTHGALRFRLARYQYKMPPTNPSSLSRVYAPIKSENRV